MTIRSRVQRAVWAIGRLFCEVPSDRMARDIADLQRHVEACDRRHAALDRQIEHLKAEYFEVFKQATRQDEPPAVRLMGDG